MKKLITLIILMASTNVYAEGFECRTMDNQLDVNVYHYNSASQGIRNAAVMILSDRTVQEGNKTIARFYENDGNLISDSANYIANVDLRFSDSRRKGENIAGTKLGQLKNIVLSLDFTYNSPVANGDYVPAALSFIKRNGEYWSEEIICTRYLKN